MSDLLVISLGTTLGLRVADAAFVEHAREAGATAEAVSVGVGALDRLRRGYPVNDLVEAAAARRALRSALARRPRAVVFSSTTASYLMPPLEIPFAVRLDSPAVLNRPGMRNALLHVLERRHLASARLVLPWSEAARAALPPGAGPSVVLPPPITASGPTAEDRSLLAVAYVPDPKAKGLDRLCAAWTMAAVERASLSVFGIERSRALAHLRRTGVPEPAGVRWPGITSSREFRSALRDARAFVSAARWEDFGQAPLEALADGALLVTSPADGAYEALRLARGLDPVLVGADRSSEALAIAIRAAFDMGGARRRGYRERAARALRPHSPESLAGELRERVLPPLLG